MTYEYKDCRAEFDGHVLSVGNSLIERRFDIDNGGMRPTAVTDKSSGREWSNAGSGRYIPNVIRADEVLFDAGTDDNGGLSDKHLRAEIKWVIGSGYISRTFEVYPSSPFVTMSMRVCDIGVYPENGVIASADGNENRHNSVPNPNPDASNAEPDTIDAFPVPRAHYRLRTVSFADKTDHTDTLVSEKCHTMYMGRWGNEREDGCLFIMDDYIGGGCLFVAKDAPYPLSRQHNEGGDFVWRRANCAMLRGTGLSGEDTAGGLTSYGSTTGVGNAADMPRLYRQFYRRVWSGHKAVIMSNTWGDRSQDSVICHDFMLGEIERAAYLGVDVVQIDDGWQHGHTVNSKIKKGGVWEGYYRADPDFWQVDREKFPYGIRPLTDKAAGYGMKMGLWFSPDSTNDFALWRRDADSILRLWREEGATCFKLDGVNIRSKRGEENILRLLDAITGESGGEISIQQDITAQIRLGGLFGKQYGTLFVENRYTDFGAYYPFQTLKNLWSLSEWLPPEKMQFELLNPRRNDDKYGQDDPFRPSLHDMDYLFACTMLSCPLVWMEMSNLPDADAERLRDIIAVYRRYRDDMALCDVIPVGEEPDGMALTGFVLDGSGHGYVLLFRETTERDTIEVVLPAAAAQVELLISNAGTEIKLSDGRLTVRIGKQKGYAFIKWC